MIEIRLDPEASEPLYGQLYEYLKSEITGGGLPCGVKLPSKRRLASSLQCSQNTVQTAYSQLMAEGYITARPKSGYYVCRLDGVLTMRKEPAAPREHAPDDSDFRYDFSHHGIDYESFPFSLWRKITKNAISEYDDGLLRAGGAQGALPLRSAIADYLHHSRGVVCAPEQIIVSSGTEFLMQLLIQIFDRDCVYAIEEPGYEKLSLLFRSNRARYVGIPLDESGMLPDALLESRADVACVTPSHQFPTGNIMPVNRRIRLLNWANSRPERYLIEDDYDSEFRYSGRPIPSLQGLDSGEKVIYLGTFSKSLAPAIRISYLVLPKPLLRVYRERLNFYLCPVPSLDQKVLYQFMKEGCFERHLNKMRTIYKKKREILMSSLQRLLPEAALSGADAGLHIVLRVENGMREDELVAAAAGQGVRVYGFSRFYAGEGSREPRLLLGFASLRPEEIPDAVRLLRRAWFPRG